jgi:hypothetical protein
MQSGDSARQRRASGLAPEDNADGADGRHARPQAQRPVGDLATGTISKTQDGTICRPAAVFCYVRLRSLRRTWRLVAEHRYEEDTRIGCVSSQNQRGMVCQMMACSSVRVFRFL